VSYSSELVRGVAATDMSIPARFSYMEYLKMRFPCFQRLVGWLSLSHFVVEPNRHIYIPASFDNDHEICRESATSPTYSYSYCSYSYLPGYLLLTSVEPKAFPLESCLNKSIENSAARSMTTIIFGKMLSLPTVWLSWRRLVQRP
jgi:hypothetical protein